MVSARTAYYRVQQRVCARAATGARSRAVLAALRCAPTTHVLSGAANLRVRATRLETNGVDISHVGLLIGRGGTIASARSDVPAGTQIGIPANLVLNQQTASAQSPQLAAAFEATAERGLTLPSDIGTAMALMYETFHNPASFWAPYVAVVPSSKSATGACSSMHVSTNARGVAAGTPS